MQKLTIFFLVAVTSSQLLIGCQPGSTIGVNGIHQPWNASSNTVLDSLKRIGMSPTLESDSNRFFRITYLDDFEDLDSCLFQMNFVEDRLVHVLIGSRSLGHNALAYFKKWREIYQAKLGEAYDVEMTPSASVQFEESIWDIDHENSLLMEFHLSVSSGQVFREFQLEEF